MRILVVAPSAYTLGGLATWLDYLLPGLTEKQWDVTLGLVSGLRHHQPRQYLAVHPFGKTVTIHSDSGTTPGRISAVRRAIRSVQPDIVLTVNIPHALKAAALERSEGRNVRAVMTCHGIQEDLFADMRLLASDLDAVVCTNRLACELADKLGHVSPDRIFHCPYGTQVPRALRPPVVNQKLTIGYAGRLEQPQKRIHDLVSIAAELRNQNRDVRFIVAGSGPEEAALKELLHRQQLTDQFTFLGFVSPSQLKDRLYKRIDALLLTSCWETGPIVIWEAMAAGTPIVTSEADRNASCGIR
jgi:glycosyltransferase involved in cell wall biosynthesis